VRAEQIYTIGLGILLLTELIFSVPLMIDSLIDNQVTYLIFIAAVGHLVWLVYGNIWTLKRRKPYIHWMGMVAFIGSFIPIFGFILHVVVSVMIIKVIKKPVNNNN